MSFIIMGCEESQEVAKAFRKKGHKAFSCDLKPCSGGHPEWHFQMDIFEVINGGMLVTQSGELVVINEWDLGIFFPPCTHLSVAGARHFAKKRLDGRQQEGIDFFMSIAKSNIKKTAIENPIGIMSRLYRKPDQVIHPYYFGDNQSKKTCLWLKNLPKLLHNEQVTLFDDKVTHNKNVEWHEWVDKRTGKKRRYSKFLADAWLKNSDKTTVSLLRSKTFPGIANAMATQWSEYLK